MREEPDGELNESLSTHSRTLRPLCYTSTSKVLSNQVCTPLIHPTPERGLVDFSLEKLNGPQKDPMLLTFGPKKWTSCNSYGELID